MTASASDLPRLLACAGGAALPQARTASAWADAGTERHAGYEEAANVGDLDGLPASVAKLLDPDMKLYAELAVAFDVETQHARRLGQGIARNYADLTPTEIPGTIDLVAIGPSRAIAIDYKGFKPTDATAQVMFAALAVADLWGRDVVETVIAPEIGRPIIQTFDGLELDAFGQRLRSLGPAIDAQRAKVAAGGLPNVNEGPHCRYCPAHDHCPAKVSLLQRMLRGDEVTTVEMMMPLDAATAPSAYERLRAMENMIKRVRAAVMAYASEHPIDLGDGKVFGPHEAMGSEKLDGDTVYQIVKDRHGQGIADAAVIRSATKSRLKEALQLAGVAKVAPAEREILDAVRAAGGATRDRRTVIEEYDQVLTP